MPAPDPDGQISLMLCESILHILVEEGVISNEKALEAIDGVVELARENDIGQSRSAGRSAVRLLKRSHRPLPLRGSTRLLPFRPRGRDRNVREYADQLGLATHAYLSQDGARLGRQR